MPKQWERQVQKKKYEDHIRRMKEMKPYIDDTEPKRMLLDSKKIVERERYLTKIEKGNRLLLDRIGKTMERKNIDNELEQRPFASIQEANRKKVLQKTTFDNRRLLSRIRHVEPRYNAIEWERDAEKRDHYLSILTEYPDRYESKYVPSATMTRAKKRFEATMSMSVRLRTAVRTASAFGMSQDEDPRVILGEDREGSGSQVEGVFSASGSGSSEQMQGGSFTYMKMDVDVDAFFPDYDRKQVISAEDNGPPHDAPDTQSRPATNLGPEQDDAA